MGMAHVLDRPRLLHRGRSRLQSAGPAVLCPLVHDAELALAHFDPAGNAENGMTRRFR